MNFNPSQMTLTRRALMKSGVVASTAAMAGVVPGLSWARESRGDTSTLPIQDARLKALVQRALDAALEAGATYADVRLVQTSSRSFNVVPRSLFADQETMIVGMRALVDGYWGFSTSPVWSADEMVRLGQATVAQAKTNLSSRPRVVDLCPAPIVRDEHWTMPVQIDPFTVYPVEILDYLRGLVLFVETQPNADVKDNRCQFVRQDKAFGSTDGSYYTQRCYRTTGSLILRVRKPGRPGDIAASLSTLSAAGAGFEQYRNQPIRDNIRMLLESLREDLMLPVKSVDVGHYDVILDASSVCRLISKTIGAATEIDRAMGYEANGSGTSYLNDPATMVGTFGVGSSLLSVTSNRHEVGGLSTVQWDDDGVVPETFPLVTQGVLQAYQTTRESASWLHPSPGSNAVSSKEQTNMRSRGGAYAADADASPLPYTGNLTMQPGKEDTDFESLIRSMKRGIAVRNLFIDMDFQQLNGFAMNNSGRAYEVKDGKRIARIANLAMLFRAPELWKNLVAIGGMNSSERFGQMVYKGEPQQQGFHSVTAVPALFKELAVIDAKRKA